MQHTLAFSHYKIKKDIFMQNLMIRFIFLLAVLFPTLSSAMSV